MKEAIQKAIEGGYDHDYTFLVDMMEGRKDTMFLLDPLFWQALGKAKGWDDDEGNIWGGKRWLGFWHDFIDHLAEGKPAEDFFTNLLAPHRE